MLNPHHKVRRENQGMRYDRSVIAAMASILGATYLCFGVIGAILLHSAACLVGTILTASLWAVIAFVSLPRPHAG